MHLWPAGDIGINITNICPSLSQWGFLASKLILETSMGIWHALFITN